MRALFNLAIIVSVFSTLFSCDIIDEQNTEADFAINNSTNFNIRLKFFNEGSDFGNFTSTLNPNESYQGATVESSIGGIFDDPEKSVVGSLISDSIIIIFNDEKLTSYTLFDNGTSTPIYSDPINRNIFRSGNYEEVSEENFIYTITQEDYNNATPCDGPCE